MPDSGSTTAAAQGSARQTLLVALLVSLVCSAVVASSSVLLRPRRLANEEANIRQNILEAAGLFTPGSDVDQLFESVETRIVDLETGTYLEEEGVDPDDAFNAAKVRELGIDVPEALDIARVSRRTTWGPVYLVREQGAVARIVLPIRGYGLWSTMHGFIALEPDGNTVAGITFYEHGETPGLGDQITDPRWRELFVGKRIYDDGGQTTLEVIKGHVQAGNPLAIYQVDGISGATLTGRGVTRLLQYWLGEHGYGRYLKSLRRGERES